jgi:hypothetical protein
LAVPSWERGNGLTKRPLTGIGGKMRHEVQLVYIIITYPFDELKTNNMEN